MLQSGKASLGDDLYKTLNIISSSTIGMLNLLNLKTEQAAIKTINRLETVIYAWKEKIMEQTSASKSPPRARTSWSLKDPSMELDKIEFLIKQVEVLSQQIKIRHLNLPQTFLDVRFWKHILMFLETWHSTYFLESGTLLKLELDATRNKREQE